MIYQDRGSYAEALAHYERSLMILEELGNRSGIANSVHQIGVIHQARGAHKQALELYQKSLRINEELGNRSGEAFTLGEMGRLFASLGQYEEALERLLNALAILAELQSPYAKTTINLLGGLRREWGTKEFDSAWQKLTGSPPPEYLEELTDAFVPDYPKASPIGVIRVDQDAHHSVG